MLPGMDGTGDLFKPLLESCPEEFEAVVLSYPRDRHADTEELVDLIRRHLPEDQAVLVAESFSGYLAIRVAATFPLKIKALILCNAFLRSPAPRLARLFPWSLMMRRKPPEQSGGSWSALVRQISLLVKSGLQLRAWIRRCSHHVSARSLWKMVEPWPRS
jgi:pimeloyl-ACP methyl ester carboxylesterase